MYQVFIDEQLCESIIGNCESPGKIIKVIKAWMDFLDGLASQELNGAKTKPTIKQ